MSEITQSGLYPFDLRIGSTQRLLSSHWAMGALMVLAVQNAATRFDLTQTHKSIGVSVLVLTLLRLGMRCFFRAPKLEPTARSVVIVGRGRARRPAHICSQLRRPLIGSSTSISPAPFSPRHTAPSTELLQQKALASVWSGTRALSHVSPPNPIDHACGSSAGVRLAEIHVSYRPATLSSVWPACC
jgi:hypothetical protein